ncbi:hypothetical protein Tco_1141406, partial [Tanacetum coccineum]
LESSMQSLFVFPFVCGFYVGVSWSYALKTKVNKSHCIFTPKDPFPATSIHGFSAFAEASTQFVIALEDASDACALANIHALAFSMSVHKRVLPSLHYTPGLTCLAALNIAWLSRVHNTFHVSNLKKCHANEPLAVPLDGLHFDDKLQFVKELVEILDREVKRLKRSRIPLVKVRWNSRRGPEFTWECEDQFRKKYPHLFTKTAPSSSAAS